MRVLKHITYVHTPMHAHRHIRTYVCMYTLSSTHCHTPYPTVQISYSYGDRCPFNYSDSHTQMLPATHTYGCWH